MICCKASRDAMESMAPLSITACPGNSVAKVAKRRGASIFLSRFHHSSHWNDRAIGVLSDLCDHIGCRSEVDGC